jgi:hypothetical protein
VDLLTQEVISFKNLLQQKNHDETIKNVQEVIEKFWETLNAMEYKETLMIENNKQIEKFKMLSEEKDPLLDFDKCSLHELIATLEKFYKDPTINVHQAGFGSYIASYFIKENIDIYNNEAMIPPKVGDAWIPKILITIDKETHHDILDLRSSVFVYLKS